jgi:hypothetical protein
VLDGATGLKGAHGTAVQYSSVQCSAVQCSAEHRFNCDKIRSVSKGEGRISIEM